MERSTKIIQAGYVNFKKTSTILPDNWPTYFLKVKNYVWDIDGHKFIDMATMGVGTNILGYETK